jgi:hypothetical protein
MTWTLQDDGKIKAPSGACTNYIDLGSRATDPVQIGGTVLVNGQSFAIPAGSSAATNTTMVVVGTTAATLKFDSKADGSLGTTQFTFNDLVRALKVAGVIVQ